MANPTVTSQLLLILQAIDNVTGLSLINHAVTNQSNAGITSASLVTNVAITTPLTITVPGTGTGGNAVFTGVYVKNMSPISADVPVTVTFGGTLQMPILHAQGIILFFQPSALSGVTSFSINPSAPTFIEYAFWA